MLPAITSSQLIFSLIIKINEFDDMFLIRSFVFFFLRLWFANVSYVITLDQVFYYESRNFVDRSVEEPKNFTVEWSPSLDLENNSKKPPNGFISFRAKYTESLKRRGINRPMHIVSKMASAAWKNLNNDEKEAYKSLSYKASVSNWDLKLNKRSMKPGSHKRKQNKKPINKRSSGQQLSQAMRTDLNGRNLHFSGFIIEFNELNYDQAAIFID
ncbi:9907_t:CDS:1 [Ambispora leptoticha]|uniref:9907_t:CDS:1 n=1 Tax=Ambispora leptoticha TaxID=144679 RepID=A0A9N9BNY4_9GLOM|nr:9907_t:CDS:1 [Ambispora leptoticha]